jgi:hypothetical protein
MTSKKLISLPDDGNIGKQVCGMLCQKANFDMMERRFNLKYHKSTHI